MVTKVKEQLEALANLQQVEIEIGGLEQSLAKVDSKLAKLDNDMLKFSKAVEKAQAELEKIRTKYSEDESRVRSLTDQIAKNEARLGSIKTNQEYQAALKDIDELKKERSKIEEVMLETLERIEAAEKKFKEKQQVMQEQKAEIEEQKKDVIESAAGRREELEQLKNKVRNMAEKVEPRLYQTYNRIKKNGAGVAVAAVDNAICQMCHMNIPPQAFNELLRMDEIKICPNCQRIIYPKECIC